MILITGTSGFIGKELLNQAVEKYGRENVIALTSKPIDTCGYILHSNYQLDSSLFEGLSIEYVIHAGAFIPKSSQEANLMEESNSNILNTTHLLNKLPKSVSSITFLSSIDVYDPSITLIDEDSPIRPVSLYGQSKLYCEALIRSWCDLNKKNYCILRIGHTYGEGEGAYSKFIPTMIRKALANENLQIFGTGEELRSLLYVKDCCQLILSILEFKRTDIFNIVSSNSYSILEVARKILSLTESTAKIEFKKTNIDPRSIRFDTTKMTNTFCIPDTPLEVGLSKEISYFKKQYSL